MVTLTSCHSPALSDKEFNRIRWNKGLRHLITLTHLGKSVGVVVLSTVPIWFTRMVILYQKKACHADYGVISTVFCSLASQLISLTESSSTMFSPFPTGQYQPFSYLCCAVATLITAFGGYLLENQTKLSSIQGKDKLLSCQSRCPSLHHRHKVFVGGVR